MVVCGSAGVMYWSDSSFDKIETSYINGTGRRILLSGWWTNSLTALLVRDGYLYLTAYYRQYVFYLFFIAKTPSAQ